MLCLRTLYWVGQKIWLGFPLRGYGKTQMNFLANPTDVISRSYLNSYPGGFIIVPILQMWKLKLRKWPAQGHITREQEAGVRTQVWRTLKLLLCTTAF